MISSHWILLGILCPHSPTTLMQSLKAAGTEKAAEKLNQPIWADDQTSWSFSPLSLMLAEPKDINIFSQHKTMQFLPQSSFTRIRANLNMVKQAKEAWVYGIFSEQSKPLAGYNTMGQRQRSSRAFCKALELGMIVYQVLPSLLSVLHLLCTLCLLELVTAQQQILPSNTEKQKVRRQVTGIRTCWAEFLGETGD